MKKLSITAIAWAVVCIVSLGYGISWLVNTCITTPVSPMTLPIDVCFWIIMTVLLSGTVVLFLGHAAIEWFFKDEED